MEGQKIPKQSRTVTFTLSDGSRIRGDVFLHLFTFRHDSTQRLDELLNDNTRFIPVKMIPEGTVVLLNLNHVVLVEAERQEESAAMVPEIGKWHRVSVKTLGQDIICGDILIDLPSESGRVQDFFNQSVKFTALFEKDREVYLNHSYILYVID